MGTMKFPLLPTLSAVALLLHGCDAPWFAVEYDITKPSEESAPGDDTGSTSAFDEVEGEESGPPDIGDDGIVEEVPDVGQLKLPCGFGCLPPCRVVLEGIEVNLARVRNSLLR